LTLHFAAICGRKKAGDLRLQKRLPVIN